MTYITSKVSRARKTKLYNCSFLYNCCFLDPIHVVAFVLSMVPWSEGTFPFYTVWVWVCILNLPSVCTYKPLVQTGKLSL
uniref:Uncharacterized protein n=1 Tax=Picea glauca TaxID=3330 RepID=A0A101M3N7_PICGL|nr:hypothetical protein ABT39_MTgene319 [Picea glauca]QHR90683.1 hypothetical protein Q903MT_gene4708 [Picea sitchensis]